MAVRLTLRVCAQVEELRAGGHNPFAYTWQRSHSCAELQQLYKELPAGELAEAEEDQVAVAGRIMAKRTFGKLAFLTMRDSTGEIQVGARTPPQHRKRGQGNVRA